MVLDDASCRIVNNFLVAEYIKSKMTRERDLGQVNFIDERFEGAANLLVLQRRIPQVVRETYPGARGVVETHEVWAFHGST